MRVQIQVDLIDQTRFLLDQPLLDRHRLTAVPAGMTQKHPRHASPPIGTGIRSSAIRHHHGLSRLPIASPAETGGICRKCLTGPTTTATRSADLYKCAARVSSPTSANADDPAASVMRRSLETLVSRLFRDSVQFCSGLVDLVVCVRRHGGGGHRFALAGERFVGLVAEDIA